MSNKSKSVWQTMYSKISHTMRKCVFRNFWPGKIRTRGPLVLYRSPECWGYVKLEQTWKYISTQCCISFHPCWSIRKQIWPCHKNSQGQPKVIIWNIGSTRVPDAVYQVSKSSASWFWRKKIFEVFHHNLLGHGHVTWNIWTNFHSPHLMEAPYEIWLQLA